MAEDEGSKNENPLPFRHRGRLRGDYAHLLRSPLKRSKPEKDGELEQSSVAAAVSADCEVEVVETEEFAFLDGMTRLATLEAGICALSNLHKKLILCTNDQLAKPAQKSVQTKGKHLTKPAPLLCMQI